MAYKTRPDGTVYWDPAPGPIDQPVNQNRSQQANPFHDLPPIPAAQQRGQYAGGQRGDLARYALDREAQNTQGHYNADIMNSRTRAGMDPMTGRPPAAPWEPGAPYTRPDGSIMPSSGSMNRQTGPLQPVFKFDPMTGQLVNTRAGQTHEGSPFRYPYTMDAGTDPTWRDETSPLPPIYDETTPSPTSPNDPGNALGTGQKFGGFNFGREQDRGESVKDSFAYWASQAPPAPTGKAELEQWMRAYVIPGMEADGHKILGIEGDKITYVWGVDGQTYTVDYAANAGSPEMTLAWGVESGPGFGGAPKTAPPNPQDPKAIQGALSDPTNPLGLSGANPTVGGYSSNWIWEYIARILEQQGMNSDFLPRG